MAKRDREKDFRSVGGILCDAHVVRRTFLIINYNRLLPFEVAHTATLLPQPRCHCSRCQSVQFAPKFEPFSRAVVVVVVVGSD